MSLDRLTPYRRSIRPVSPESFPRFVEQELDKVSINTIALLEVIKDLEARLRALEP